MWRHNLSKAGRFGGKVVRACVCTAFRLTEHRAEGLQLKANTLELVHELKDESCQILITSAMQGSEQGIDSTSQPKNLPPRVLARNLMIAALIKAQ